MLKKALTFLGFFLAITLTIYCLNTYAKINTELATNTSVGYYKNTETTIATYSIVNNNKTVEVNAPEKVMTGTITFVETNSPVHICNTSDIATFTFDYSTSADYDETTTFSALAADGALEAVVTDSFSPTSFGPGPTLTATQLDMQVSGLSGYAPGTYNITVTATGDGGASASDIVTLVIDEPTVSSLAIPTAPINGATGVSISGTTFTWTAGTNSSFHFLQVSTDPTFPFPSLLIDEKIVGVTSFTSLITLSYGTVYYWRVRSSNECDNGTYGATQNFQTEAFVDSCTSYPSGVSVPILDNNTTTDIITIAGPGITLSNVNVTVDIGHQFIGDLTLSLISPLGTEVQLVNQNCGSTISLNLTFDDSGTTFVCNTATSKPTGSLASFNGENTTGNWTLKIVDNTALSTGTLNSWSLELCEAVPATVVNSVLSPHDDYNFISSSVGSEIVPLHLEATSAGSTALQQVFTITQLPTYTLLKSGVAFTAIGETFTQDDINNNLITYDNTAPGTETDTFMVDITNATNGFLPNQVVTINLDLDALLGVDDDFFLKTGISIFPTVSNGEFKITSSNYIGTAVIELYTYTGKRVFRNELNLTNGVIEPINASNLASGIYILKLISDTAVGSKKIVIQ